MVQGAWNGDDRIDRDGSEEQDESEEEPPDGAVDSFLKITVGFEVEVDGAMHGEHGEGEESDKNRIGVELREESAGEVAVLIDLHAIYGISHGDAEKKGRAGGAGEEAPIPESPPGVMVHFGAELDAHGAGDQHEEKQHECRIETGEDGFIGEGEHGEERSAEGDEPDFIAVPDGSDGVDCDAALGIGARRKERMHDADAEIETVQDGVTAQKYAKHNKPDDAEHFIGHGRITPLAFMPHPPESRGLRSDLLRGRGVRRRCRGNREGRISIVRHPRETRVPSGFYD